MVEDAPEPTRAFDDDMMPRSHSANPMTEGKAAASTPSAPIAARRRRPPIGWVVFIAVVVAGGAGLVFGQNALVEAWPPAALLYQTVGAVTPAPGAGLQLPAPKAEIRRNGGTSVLVVDGQILNPSGQEQAIPPLRATPTDPSGKMLEGWTFEASLRSLLPGEIATYHSEHMIDGAVAEVTVSFY